MRRELFGCRPLFQVRRQKRPVRLPPRRDKVSWRPHRGSCQMQEFVSCPLGKTAWGIVVRRYFAVESRGSSSVDRRDAPVVYQRRAVRPYLLRRVLPPHPRCRCPDRCGGLGWSAACRLDASGGVVHFARHRPSQAIALWFAGRSARRGSLINQCQAGVRRVRLC